MNDFLLTLAGFVVMLVPMILIHELGHFLAAKLVGITVLEFGLGFPPRALKLFERNGTEYTLNWLPLGGFVRPLGEDFVRPVSDEEASGDWADYRVFADTVNRRPTHPAIAETIIPAKRTIQRLPGRNEIDRLIKQFLV